jgi:hypothetical protein
LGQKTTVVVSDPVAPAIATSMVHEEQEIRVTIATGDAGSANDRIVGIGRTAAAAGWTGTAGIVGAGETTAAVAWIETGSAGVNIAWIEIGAVAGAGIKKTSGMAGSAGVKIVGRAQMEAGVDINVLT